MRRMAGLCLVSAIVWLAGCASQYNRIPAGSIELDALKTSATYDIIGEATGTSTGGTLFWLWSIGCEDKYGNVVNCGPQNVLSGGAMRTIGYGSTLSHGTVESAAIYNAIESVPMADALLAPRVSVERKSYVFYSEQTVTVKGKAIRYNVSAK